jgi:MFS family permease
VVAPEERSAAAGITGVARTVGASFAPVITGLFLANPAWLNLPFFISGGLKIAYDLALYRSFRSLKPPEEN